MACNGGIMTDTHVKEIIDGNFRARIFQDEFPMNPLKDWDMQFIFSCFHRNYDLSCKVNEFPNTQDGMRLFNEFKAEIGDKAVWFPIYIYDHSGITVNLTGFSCPWDSGQVGYVWQYKSVLMKNYGQKKWTKNFAQKMWDVAKSETATLDDYVTGNVYGYQIDKKETDESWDDEPKIENIDSCYGFFGDPDDKSQIMEEIRSVIKYQKKIETDEIKRERSEHKKKLKALKTEISPISLQLI